MIKFTYKPILLNDERGMIIFRPIIPVVLTYGKEKFGWEALIDSGSDRCFFPAVIGEFLGIKVTKGKREEFEGIKGEYGLAYFHEIQLAVGKKVYRAECGFSYDMSEEVGILGQNGFFDQFDVKFSLKNKEISLF